jgi:tetratricopeptide (TPR) repeat protein
MLKKIILVLVFLALTGSCYSLNIDKVKIYFLNDDYKSAISEGEKVLAGYDLHSPNLDELYYFLALSYLKAGNYLRASDIFEIILREFKDSPFRDEAKLGLGDAYFLKGDYDKAKACYSGLLESNPRTKFKELLYSRLSETAFKTGDTQAAKEYLNKDLPALADGFYTVQVGFFSSAANARRLCDKLTAKGYDAYLQEVGADTQKAYRVRVGKLNSRQEAAQLESKLSSEGYPTKIFP